MTSFALSFGTGFPCQFSASSTSGIRRSLKVFATMAAGSLFTRVAWQNAWHKASTSWPSTPYPSVPPTGFAATPTDVCAVLCGRHATLSQVVHVEDRHEVIQTVVGSRALRGLAVAQEAEHPVAGSGPVLASISRSTRGAQPSPSDPVATSTDDSLGVGCPSGAQ